MTDAEWNEDVRRRAVKLSSLFGAIATHVDPNSVIGIMARKGGLLALDLCSEAAGRNISAGLEAEQAEVAASGYDLAALATAAPAVIED